MTAKEFIQLIANKDRIETALKSHESYNEAIKVYNKIKKLTNKRENLKRQKLRRKNVFIDRIPSKKLFSSGVYDIPTIIRDLEKKYPSSDYSVRWYKSLLYPFFNDSYIEIRGLEKDGDWERRKSKLDQKIERINIHLKGLDEKLMELMDDENQETPKNT